MTEKYRWGRAVAALAGIAVVLVALVVVSHRGSGRKAAPVPAPAAEIPSAPFVGPVTLGGVLTVTGDPGYRAQLQVVPGRDAGVLSFTVHVRNLGTKPFDGSVKSGVWVATDSGTLVGPRSVGPSASATVGAGEKADRTLVFPAPGEGRPTQLRITLHLGTYFPTAEWALPA